MQLIFFLIQLLILPAYAQTSLQQYTDNRNQYIQNKQNYTEDDRLFLGKALLVTKIEAFSEQVFILLPELKDSPEITGVLEEFSQSVKDINDISELQSFEQVLNFTLRDSLALFRVETGLEQLAKSRDYARRLRELEQSIKKEAILAQSQGHDISLVVSKVNSAVSHLNDADENFNKVDGVLNAGKATSYRQGEYLKIRNANAWLVEGNKSLILVREDFLLSLEALQNLHNKDPWRLDEKGN